MHIFSGYIVVFFGAGLGGMLRHGVNRLSLAWLGSGFPWNTAFINVTGSLAMGLIAGWLAFRSQGSEQTLRLFLTTGILGGYTTFSAFSLDAALLWERGHLWPTALYVLGSVVLSIAGVFAGLALMRTVN